MNDSKALPVLLVAGIFSLSGYVLFPRYLFIKDSVIVKESVTTKG